MLSIHEHLKSLKLYKRELIWTIPITNLTRWDEQNIVDEILKWAFKVPKNLVSDEQAKLLALLLSWLLSSNNRFLRKRASLALTRVLCGRLNIAVKLIEEFHNCNDPYIVERIYAAACGAALRETDKDSLGYLTDVVYKHMFANETVPPHILQRDYAQSIIEYALHCGALSSTVEIKRCRPLFRSKWPRIISEEKAKKIENEEGWSRIKFSVQPEECGRYGDFGRYVMGARIHSFSTRTHKQKPTQTYREMGFNGKTARRWVLQRVWRLGWSSQKFGKYEKRLNSGRLRVERISKKYQWIALYEFLGYLSDRYRLSHTWNHRTPAFSGAWQIRVRDFDPTQPLTDPSVSSQFVSELLDLIMSEKSNDWWRDYPNPFADSKLRFDRKAWVESLPKSFVSLINHKSIPSIEGKWLTLSGHFDWIEELSISQDEAIDGHLKMSLDVRCWLIKKGNRKQFIEEVEDSELWGKGCDNPNINEQWLGEYPWAPSMKKVREFLQDDTAPWLENISVPSIQTVCEYHNEKAGIWTRLPSPRLCELLGLRWLGKTFEFMNNEGETIAFCPTEPGLDGSSPPLLVEKEKLLSALDKAGLDIVWATLSERSCFSHKLGKAIVPKWSVAQRLYFFENDIFTCRPSKKYPIPLNR